MTNRESVSLPWHLVAACIVFVSSMSGSALADVSLAPPKGSTLIGRYAAKGVQVYTCIAKQGGMAWGPAEPDADLEDADGKVSVHHSKGPSWEARDGSKVVGAVASMKPATIANAVPWLLLSATTTGSGLLAGTRYVVRQDTSGGVAPADGCRSIGSQARVPYTATYAFYR